MSGQYVDFVVNSAEEILDIPLKVVKNGVVHPLLDMPLKTFIGVFTLALVLDYTLLSWASAPASCVSTDGTGACRKLVLGFDALALLVLQVFAVAVVFVLTYKGLREFGLKPKAFSSVLTVLAVWEFVSVFFEKLFIVAVDDSDVHAASGDGVPFKTVAQTILYRIIRTLQFAGNETPFILAIIGAMVAASLK